MRSIFQATYEGKGKGKFTSWRTAQARSYEAMFSQMKSGITPEASMLSW